MKVFFIGFWEGFYEINRDKYALLSNFATPGVRYKGETTDVDWIVSPVSYFLILLENILNEEMELGTLENSDILVEGVFNKETFLTYKNWKYTFLFSGESDRRVWASIQGNLNRLETFNKYSCILKGEKNNNNIINLPFFSVYAHCFDLNNKFINKEIIKTVPKKKICVIVSNGHDSEGRNNFFEILENYFEVDYAGRYKNNVKQITSEPFSKEFIEFVSQYKFIIAMENSKNETYITEKILHGFAANTIPIYWGSNYVTEYFNKDRFINVENYDKETIDCAIKRILEIDNDDEKYLQMVNSPIYSNNNSDNWLFKIETIASQIKDLICKK